MRLIDADKLPYVNKVILVDDVDGDIVITIAKEYTSYVNDETPTVKAIPVEWIKKYLNRLEIISKDNIGLGEEGCYNEIITIESMLSNWEKENEMR